MNILLNLNRFKYRMTQAANAIFVSIGLLLMPLAAYAQDPDEKPIPLDPRTVAAQNRAIGIILTLIAVGIAWYYIRRWQIVHNPNKTNMSDQSKE